MNIHKIARTGGILYLVIILTGLFGEMFVRENLVVPGDATATANNIMASPMLWRIGIAGDLLMHICDVGVMAVFYLLFRPVNKPLVILAILFNLVQTAVLVINKLNLFMPLFLLGNSDYLQAFEPAQLHALLYLSIRMHSYGFGLGLIFFGMECIIIGYLVIRSGYLPKIIGVMMQVAGLCYLVNSFALVLSPRLASALFPFIMLPPFVAELSFAGWLVIKGVNREKWQNREGILHQPVA